VLLDRALRRYKDLVQGMSARYCSRDLPLDPGVFHLPSNPYFLDLLSRTVVHWHCAKETLRHVGEVELMVDPVR
jgi:hypothetical protein